jgi:hypothetical protein
MRQMTRRGLSPARASGLGLAFAVFMLVGSAVLAQEDGGRRAVFGITQGFSADSNRDLVPGRSAHSFASTTNLRFGLRSETRTEQFRLETGAGLRFFGIRGERHQVQFSDPEVSASYRRDGARAGLLLSGRYVREDLRFLRTLDDLVESVPVLDDQGVPIPEDVIILPENPGDLIGRGTRTLTDLSARFDFGRDGPIASTLTADYRALRYSDGATDPDNTRTSLGAETRLRVSPVTIGQLRLSFSRFEAEDEVRLQRDRIGMRFGLQQELSKVLEVTVGVGPSRVITRNRIDGSRDVRSGIDGDVSATYNLPSGTIGLRLSIVTDEDGARRSISLLRNLELPRGSLSGSLGLTRAADGERLTTARLDYRHLLPRGSLSVQFNRDFGVDARDETQVFTGLTASYEHTINRVSSLGLNARYLSRDLGDEASLVATYRRALTPDWNMNLGYRYDLRERDFAGIGTRRVNNHGIFLNLSKSIDIGL